MAAALRKSNIQNLFNTSNLFIACLNGPGCKAHSAVRFYYLKYRCTTEHVPGYQQDDTNLRESNITVESVFFLHLIS